MAFAVVAATMQAGQLVALDAALAVSHGGLEADMAQLFRTVTHLGGLWVVAPLTALACAVLAVRGRFADALTVALAAGAARVLTAVLKEAFARERPGLVDAIATESSPAFPSGHTSAATALYGALALLLLRSGLPRWQRVGGAGLLGAMVVVVGYSRVYLGVHYPSDVLAGALLGGACLGAAVSITAGVRARNRSPLAEAVRA